jgi:hypothetical protein
MRAAVVAPLVAGALGAVLGIGVIQGEPVKLVKADDPKLWAAVSVKPPVFDPYTFTFDRPRMHLGLVNDGTQVLETGLRESVLVVNGQPQRGDKWDTALMECLRGRAWEKLQPGEHTEVICSLDEIITGPGTYRVSWRGKNFQSPEAMLRILPRISDIRPKPTSSQVVDKPASSNDSQVKLWAAVSIIPPVLIRDTSPIERSQIHLYLMNDGAHTIVTGADDSVLVVNGQPLWSWNWTSALRSGLRSGTWMNLPPGKHTGIVRSLHTVITEPGIYRASWKGQNFQSPEIVYRIMPAKAK